jgi:hypothetical protein
LVLADQRIRVSLTADEVVISEATVLKMLHEDLGMNKVSAHVGFRNCLIPNKDCEENLGTLSDDEELF